MTVFGTGALPPAPAPRPGATPAERRVDEAKHAAAMMEGLFIRQLMRCMRQTVPKSSLFGESTAMNIYKEMFDGGIVDEVSRGNTGFGMREELMRQLQGGSGPLISASGDVSPGAAAALRRLASQGAARQVTDAALQHGVNLSGVAYEAPRRSMAGLADPDGRLEWPVDGTPASDARGRIPGTRGADVMAAGSGRVVSADANSLVLDHGGGLRTVYRGLGQVEAQRGDLVLRGQTLGSVSQREELGFSATKNGHAMEPAEIQGMLKRENNDDG